MSRTGSKSRDPKKKAGSKGKVPKKDEPIVDQDLWPARLLQARQWGHTLEKKEGTHQASVKKLLTTLKDQRTNTEQPLRLSAVQSLTPAAAVGHRGALAAQAQALLDRRKVVRESALDGLWEAAGHQRPELGGAVHSQLRDVLPPADARYQVESRRAASDALMRLGPRGDEVLLSIVREWLEDEDAEVRASAAQATGFLGSSVADVERLAPLLKDKNWRVAKAAIDALEQISGGEGIRHKCGKSGRETSQDFSRRTPSNSSRSSSKLYGSRTMPTLSVGSRPGTSGSRLETPDTERHSGNKRSNSKLSSPSEASLRSESSASGMPRASAALMAASSALATPSFSEGPAPTRLLGLPRADAVASLRRIAPWGHGSALDAVAARLRDTDDLVRKEAVLAVAELAPGNRQKAFDLCAWAMEEVDWRARAAAVDAFAASAPSGGDEQAFWAAAELLTGFEWATRRGGINALRALLLTEDEPKDRSRKLDFAIEAVAPKLQHEHWSVRRFAVIAMAGVCEVLGGHRKGLRKVKELTSDPDEQVRLALAAHLGRVAPLKSKEAVLAALQLACKDDDLEVRVAALAAVEELCAEERCRTRKAVKQVAQLFADAEEEVRQTAQRVMCNIGRDRRCAVDALTHLLENPREEVRLLAAETFKSVVGLQQPRATKRAMRLVRRSSRQGVRDAASKAIALGEEKEETATAQDPQVILAASSMVMKWRPNRFQGIRGNLLSPEERLANYAARGEDPSRDEEWLELFGPRKPKAKSKKGKAKKRKNSQQSSTLSRGDTSSQISESEAGGEGDESDDNKSTTSKQSDATASSRLSKASKQSSALDSKHKGKSGAELRRLQVEEERDRAKRDKDRQQRLKDMQSIMESSSEEEFSESETEEESDEDDMMTAVEKILTGAGPVR